jgi:hypothetical protein
VEGEVAADEKIIQCDPRCTGIGRILPVDMEFHGAILQESVVVNGTHDRSMCGNPSLWSVIVKGNWIPSDEILKAGLDLGYVDIFVSLIPGINDKTVCPPP